MANAIGGVIKIKEVGIKEEENCRFEVRNTKNVTGREEFRIFYSVGERSYVSLVIYDVCGRKVRTLVKGVKEKGKYEVKWDMKDGDGKDIKNGIYFYHFKLGEKSIKKKIIYLK